MHENEYRSQLNKMPALTNVTAFALHRSMFIGCGGLGFETVNLLKKRAVDYFGDEGEWKKVLKFLVIDSATAQPQEGDSVLDKSTEIKRLDLTDWEDTTRNHPGVRGQWFPDIMSMQDEVRETILREFPAGAQGCGTTRIFGRLGMFKGGIHETLAKQVSAFAGEDVPQTIHINGYDSAIDVKNSTELYFYIVSTIGGGTGTGIFMDVAAIIRHAQARLGRDQNWHIYGILITPTVIGRHDPSGGLKRLNANSYATIKELKHFLEGNEFTARYDPHEKTSVSVEGSEFVSSLFNVVFLVDGETHTDIEFANRLQIANSISGMLFSISSTLEGEHHFQRFIDQTMSGIFTNRVPESPRGQIIDAQRPSFSSYGWATAHIPLEEMIRYARLKAVIDILKCIGADDSSGTGQGSREDVSAYFFTPKTGAEDDKFIDKTGMSKIISKSFWNMTVDSPDPNEPGTTVSGTGSGINVSFFRKCAKYHDDPDGHLEQVLDMKRHEIESFVRETINGDVDAENLEKQIKAFLKDYLLWDNVIREFGLPEDESALGQAVEEALKEKTGSKGFVIEGLEAFLEILSTLEYRMNVEIEDGKNRYKNLARKRKQSFSSFEDLNNEILTTCIPFFGKYRLRDVLDEFVHLDNQCKRVAFRVAVLEKVVREILPAYRDQVTKWYHFILDINRKVEGIIARVTDLKNRALRDIETDTVCEFNIDFHERARRFFYGRFCEQIGLDDIKKDIMKNGLRIGNPPSFVPIHDAVNQMKPGEIIDNIIHILENATEPPRHAESGSLVPTIFALNFDDFTGRDRDQHFFLDREDGGDVQNLHKRLVRNSEPLLKITGDSAQKTVYYVFDSEVWKKRMSNEKILTGLYPHKITRATFHLGIAPFQLFYIRQWYRDYKELLHAGWPLHVFKDAEQWDEPYTVYHYEKNPEEVFNLARKDEYGGLIREEGTDKTYSIRKVIIDRFVGSDCRFTIVDNKRDIITELNSNSRIHREVSEAVYEKLSESKNADQIRDLITGGAFAAQMVTRLSQYRELVKNNTPIPPVKNPGILFTKAVDVGVVEKEKDELYRLKVTSRPVTRTCDYLIINETRQNIIDELGINEPLYEEMCQMMILHVETCFSDPEQKKKLMEPLIDILPPHLKEILEPEYGIASP